MQAKSIDWKNVPYTQGMPAGRPKKSERTDFAQRLAALREAAGLSQRQMATLLDISQPSYALWEQRNVSLRADQLLKLSEVLGVSLDELFGQVKKPTRRGGPQGRARKSFESISKLPNHKQKKILDVVDALLVQADGTQH